MGSNPVAGILIRENRQIPRVSHGMRIHREATKGHMKTEAEIGEIKCKPRTSGLLAAIRAEEKAKDSSSEASEGAIPEVRYITFRTVRK